jgi:hypothetical protein
MQNLIKTTALALAASGMAATAVPAAAADFGDHGYSAAPAQEGWNKHRRDDRRWDRRGRNDRYDSYDSRSAYGYGEPVYRNTQVWRGQDGRTYCRNKNGTTGLIIGGAAGALLGREVDGGRSRTLGTILGAAAGALIGKELDDGVKCR